MIPGLATKDPLKLCPCIRSFFLDVIEECREKGVPLVTIETFRDVKRQKYYVETGVSSTMNSKHLPQQPNNLSLAFDCAPKSVLALKGWAPGHGDWKVYGAAGKRLGLTWGADWVTFKDYPHMQLDACCCPKARP